MEFHSTKPDDGMLDAARKGDMVYLQQQIDQSADINIRDARGHTPLILACYNRNKGAAELLIKMGPIVNLPDTGGRTVCFKGYDDIARLLIDKGAALVAQNTNGGTALMFAAMFCRKQLLKTLLDHGADKSIRDQRGMAARTWPISRATKKRSPGFDPASCHISGNFCQIN